MYASTCKLYEKKSYSYMLELRFCHDVTRPSYPVSASTSCLHRRTRITLTLFPRICLCALALSTLSIFSRTYSFRVLPTSSKPSPSEILLVASRLYQSLPPTRLGSMSQTLAFVFLPRQYSIHLPYFIFLPACQQYSTSTVDVSTLRSNQCVYMIFPRALAYQPRHYQPLDRS